MSLHLLPFPPTGSAPPVMHNVEITRCSVDQLLRALSGPRVVDKQACRELFLLRRKWGISLADLAAVSGYTAGTFKQWEFKRGRVPRTCSMVDWLAALVMIRNEQN